MSKHFRIPSRMPARLAELGIGMPALLREAGLTPGLWDQPRVLVTTEAFFALWRGIERLSSVPAIGLELGTEAKEYFDPVTLTALSTANFGEAIRQMARYKKLSCPEAIANEVDGDEWSVKFLWLLADGIEPAVLTDMCFAWVLNVARHGTGTKLSPLRLELARSAANTRIYERHFGCPVHFGAARNAIVFRASDAALPFVTRNAELLAMLAPQFDEALEQMNRQESFAEGVRGAIQRKLTGRRPKVQEIARELRISPRTLQRRLQDDGFSFQQVLEQARHQLARHYLNNAALELNEAAYLLGYEDSNSFVRAFRTWEGVPPGCWREAQRAALRAE